MSLGMNTAPLRGLKARDDSRIQAGAGMFASPEPAAGSGQQA